VGGRNLPRPPPKNKKNRRLNSNIRKPENRNPKTDRRKPITENTNPHTTTIDHPSAPNTYQCNTHANNKVAHQQDHNEQKQESK
ncbi:hypothetical protein AAHH80_35170, partial [Burkholderia pseudomallei]